MMMPVMVVQDDGIRQEVKRCGIMCSGNDNGSNSNHKDKNKVIDIPQLQLNVSDF